MPRMCRASRCGTAMAPARPITEASQFSSTDPSLLYRCLQDKCMAPCEAVSLRNTV